MKRKLTVCIAIVLCMSFAFSACGNVNTEKTIKLSELFANGRVAITVSSYNDSIYEDSEIIDLMLFENGKFYLLKVGDTMTVEEAYEMGNEGLAKLVKKEGEYMGRYYFDLVSYPDNGGTKREFIVYGNEDDWFGWCNADDIITNPHIPMLGGTLMKVKVLYTLYFIDDAETRGKTLELDIQTTASGEIYPTD